MPNVGSIIAIVVVLVAAVICGRFPLLANPGPEAGLILAVVGGVALALAGAVRGSQQQKSGFQGDWRHGILLATIATAIFLVSTTIGAALNPTCSTNGGRLPMLILSAPVLCLQAAIGPVVGRIVGGRGHWLRAVVVTFLLEVAIAGTIAINLHSEPGFRVASHFFVVISGDLLRGASLPVAAIGFRMATGLLAAAIVLIATGVWPAEKTRGLVSGQTTDSLRLWSIAAVLLVVFVVAHTQARQALVPSRSEMEETYSLTKRRGPLVVHADPLALSVQDVDGILAEGTLWWQRLDARLGTLATDEVHIWLHANRTAMAHYTGASHVDFALPWRRELHIAGAEVPHRTLGHELAHVVVGDKSDRLLKVPSRFVMMHNAAVTEGVAMALTPELAIHDGLTLREQAAAMRRAGHAPNLEALFSFNRFFAESPSRAYVAAGALIERLVADAGGARHDVIERLYRGSGDLGAAINDPQGNPSASADERDLAVAQLIARHEADLDALPLPRDALAFAQARFSRPSVLDEVCEPDADEERQAIRGLARTGGLDEAIARANRLAGYTVADGTLTDLLLDVQGVDDDIAAVGLLERLVEMAPSPAEKAIRLLALGNTRYRLGDERAAVQAWNDADVEAAVFDVQRQLHASRRFGEVVLRLGRQAPLARAALRYFAATDRTRNGARLHFAEEVGRAHADAEESGVVPEGEEILALADYVLGRQLVFEGVHDAAVRHLRPLIEAQGPLREGPAFREQALLAMATAFARRQKPDDAQALFLSAAEGATRPAMRLMFRDRADRARRAGKAPLQPSSLTATSDPAWADRLLLGRVGDRF